MDSLDHSLLITRSAEVRGRAFWRNHFFNATAKKKEYTCDLSRLGDAGTASSASLLIPIRIDVTARKTLAA